MLSARTCKFVARANISRVMAADFVHLTGLFIRVFQNLFGIVWYFGVFVLDFFRVLKTLQNFHVFFEILECFTKIKSPTITIIKTIYRIWKKKKSIYYTRCFKILDLGTWVRRTPKPDLFLNFYTGGGGLTLELFFF